MFFACPHPALHSYCETVRTWFHHNILIKGLNSAEDIVMATKLRRTGLSIVSNVNCMKSTKNNIDKNRWKYMRIIYSERHFRFFIRLFADAFISTLLLHPKTKVNIHLNRLNLMLAIYFVSVTNMGMVEREIRATRTAPMTAKTE